MRLIAFHRQSLVLSIFCRGFGQRSRQSPCKGTQHTGIVSLFLSLKVDLANPIDSDDLRQKLVRYNEENDGKQRGDPAVAAKVMLDLVSGKHASIPLRLALGSDSMANIRQTYMENLQELEQWQTISCSTDFA